MLHYERFGSGPTLLFLHGFLEESSIWKYFQITKLKFDCLLIDLPGHGKSETARIGTISEIADLIIEILDVEKIQEFSIIGHSLGGYVALELCKKQINFKRCILLNSNYWEDSLQKKEDRNRVAALVLSKHKSFVTEAIPNLFAQVENYQQTITFLINTAKKMHAKAIAQMTISMKNRIDNTEFVRNNREKIIFVQGTLDNIMPVSQARLNCLNDKIFYCEIKHAGHMIPIEAGFELFLLLSQNIH